MSVGWPECSWAADHAKQSRSTGGAWLRTPRAMTKCLRAVELCSSPRSPRAKMNHGAESKIKDPAADAVETLPGGKSSVASSSPLRYYPSRSHGCHGSRGPGHDEHCPRERRSSWTSLSQAVPLSQARSATPERDILAGHRGPIRATGVGKSATATDWPRSSDKHAGLPCGWLWHGGKPTQPASQACQARLDVDPRRE